MKVRTSLADAARRLATISDTPRLDAELLMARALGMPRERMLLSRLDDPAPADFDPLVARRLEREPIAYILGRRAFWTIELEVGPGVLVPRPDSETLLEAAIGWFGERGPATILDLGTGPGTLLLAALDQWRDARGLGVDRSETALRYARANAERLGVGGRAEFRTGDWAAGIEEHFDLILCNPPYVETGSTLPGEVSEWEPHEALFAGPDGLDDYRRLAAELPGLIAPGGVACVEIGAAQEAAVTALFGSRNMAISCRRDLAGRPRCLLLSP